MTTPSEEAVAAAFFVFVCKARHPVWEEDDAALRAALRAAYDIDMERVRREALEEAAKVAEEQVTEWYNDEATTTYGWAYQAGARRCATAIRALANTELPPMCNGCCQNRADPPSKLCPGCQAYRDHQT